MKPILAQPTQHRKPSLSALCLQRDHESTVLEKFCRPRFAWNVPDQPWDAPIVPVPQFLSFANKSSRHRKSQSDWPSYYRPWCTNLATVYAEYQSIESKNIILENYR